ncbi:sodium-dependent multivitamin transporter-like [Haliotis rubra]|uniref:sodium-dependent multivitamin transporter-like n=1 Tax=Haliotis rubra TaxID=36100 RepID=UPI001EE50074|nr:sodium-dependent multivitamin transporter-like [Haliotis rubra]
MELGYSINSGHRNTLHWEDYLVFGCTLLIPACVGLYHALKDRKKNSPSDFLVGNRQMGTVPVALSVTVTFLSALTLLGMPAEVYIHDTMFWLLALGMILAVAGAAHLFIPILYRLGVTSVYEYFELRFGKRVRILASLNWILQVLLYMAFVLYAPSLALYSVTGFNLWLSISTVGVIVTIYTALGAVAELNRPGVNSTDLVSTVTGLLIHAFYRDCDPLRFQEPHPQVQMR